MTDWATHWRATAGTVLFTGEIRKAGRFVAANRRYRVLSMIKLRRWVGLRFPPDGIKQIYYRYPSLHQRPRGLQILTAVTSFLVSEFFWLLNVADIAVCYFAFS
jgi:hypothetical protein